MIEKLYKILWTRVGGRPWTYILRDSMKKNPLIWLVAAQIIGILIFRSHGSMKSHPLYWILGAQGAGIVLGHLFW